MAASLRNVVSRAVSFSVSRQRASFLSGVPAASSRSWNHRFTSSAMLGRVAAAGAASTSFRSCATGTCTTNSPFGSPTENSGLSMSTVCIVAIASRKAAGSFLIATELMSGLRGWITVTRFRRCRGSAACRPSW